MTTPVMDHGSAGWRDDVKNWRAELKQVGVVLEDPVGAWLVCRVCRQRWSPMLQRGGTLPHNYEICPNDCNKSALRRLRRLERQSPWPIFQWLSVGHDRVWPR
jgi:hypothetical protein